MVPQKPRASKRRESSLAELGVQGVRSGSSNLWSQTFHLETASALSTAKFWLQPSTAERTQCCGLWTQAPSLHTACRGGIKPGEPSVSP